MTLAQFNMEGRIALVTGASSRGIGNGSAKILAEAGAKVFLVGIPHFMMHKEAELKANFTDPDEVISVKGMIMSAEPIEGRKDI